MRFHCDKCGWVSFPPERVRVLYHSCTPPRGRRKLTPLPDAYEGTTPEEAKADAWATLFESRLSRQRKEEEE